MALTDNLAAYYKLDESSGNASDSSGNSNTLLQVNSPTFSTGKINNGALMASASYQYFAAVDSASLSITGNITISFWIKMTSQPASGQMALITKDTAGTSNRSFWTSYNYAAGTNQLWMGIFPSGTPSNISYVYWNYTLTTGTWFYVTYVCTPANAISTKFELFINGTSQGNGTGTNVGSGATSIYDSTTYLGMGQYIASPMIAGLYLDGMIDEAGIWSRALSSSEITSLYNSGNGLQYPFSSPSGPTNLKSLSGNLKANIKSFSGNTLANMKSLAGNA